MEMKGELQRLVVEGVQKDLIRFIFKICHQQPNYFTPVKH